MVSLPAVPEPRAVKYPVFLSGRGGNIPRKTEHSDLAVLLCLPGSAVTLSMILFQAWSGAWPAGLVWHIVIVCCGCPLSLTSVCHHCRLFIVASSSYPLAVASLLLRNCPATPLPLPISCNAVRCWSDLPKPGFRQSPDMG